MLGTVLRGGTWWRWVCAQWWHLVAGPLRHAGGRGSMGFYSKRRCPHVSVTWGGASCPRYSREGDLAGEGLAPALPTLRALQQDADPRGPRRGKSGRPRSRTAVLRRAGLCHRERAARLRAAPCTAPLCHTVTRLSLLPSQHDGQPYCHKPCYGILFGPKGECWGCGGRGDARPNPITTAVHVPPCRRQHRSRGQLHLRQRP